MSTVVLRPGGSLRGAAWLSLRQDRTALLAGAVVLLALCGWLLFLGGQIDSWIAANGVRECNAREYTPACQSLWARATEQPGWWSLAVTVTGWVLYALPVLLGLLVGAPLLAREFESGTYRLAWTQSVSRTGWLVRRLAAPLLLTLVGASALAVVSGWFARVVEGHLGALDYADWFSLMPRATTGPAMAGQCVLAVALGVVVGLLVRRVVAAMAVTALLAAAARVLTDRLRYLAVPAREVVVPVGPPVDRFHTRLSGVDLNAIPVPSQAHVVETGFRTVGGVDMPLDADRVVTLADGSTRCELMVCTREQVDAFAQVYSAYHPRSQEWLVTWTQAGICLTVTTVLLGFCLYWCRAAVLRDPWTVPGWWRRG
ncbi:hypothetical protein ACIRBX_35210 [Kitasatospora sp. NPDC096147]|uniref:hypothetical protein n=1 Tax=Kitasatospora sp. NPDC096147 TaxID=3364093 RepID=UPI003830F97F